MFWALYSYTVLCKVAVFIATSFSSTDFSFKRGYMNAVCRELELRIHELKDEPVLTVYLGGDSVQFIAVGTRIVCFELFPQLSIGRFVGGYS